MKTMCIAFAFVMDIDYSCTGLMHDVLSFRLAGLIKQTTSNASNICYRIAAMPIGTSTKM